MARNSIISGSSLPSTPAVGDVFIKSGVGLHACDTSTVWRSVGSSIAVFNVKDYGALGNDSADDITAINLTVTTAVAAGGGTVFFPSGTYRISTPIKITNNIQFLGVGVDSTIIKPTANVAGFLCDTIANGGLGASATHWSIKHLLIDYVLMKSGSGPSNTTSAKGISLVSDGSNYAWFYEVSDVKIQWAYYGVYDYLGSFLGAYKRMWIQHNRIGMYKLGGTTIHYENVFVTGSVDNGQTVAWNLANTYDVIGWDLEGVLDSTITASASNGICAGTCNYFYNCHGLTINGFDVENNLTLGTNNFDSIIAFNGDSSYATYVANGIAFPSSVLNVLNSIYAVTSFIKIDGYAMVTLGGLQVYNAGASIFYPSANGGNASSWAGIIFKETNAKLFINSSTMSTLSTRSGAYVGGIYGTYSNGGQTIKYIASVLSGTQIGTPYDLGAL